MHTLIIHSRIDGTDARYQFVDAKGKSLGDVQTGLPRRMEQRHRIIWFVKAEDMLITQCELATRNRGKLRQAIPFALEDQLASDIDELMFAFESQDGVSHVAVASHDLLHQGLAVLAEQGLYPQHIVPDVLALPHREQMTTVVVEGCRALFKTGDASGFVTELEHFPLAISQLPIPDDEQHQWWLGGDALEHAPDAIKPMSKRLPDDLMTLLARGVQTKGLPDFASLIKTETTLERPVRLNLIAMAVVLLLAFVVLLGERWMGILHFDAMTAQYQQQSERLLKLADPSIGRIQDVKIQMQQLLNARGKTLPTNGQLLATLLDVAEHLNAQKGMKMTALNYNEGSLRVNVTGQSLGQIDQLRDNLMQAGNRQVTLGSVNASDKGVVTAQITIEAQS